MSERDNESFDLDEEFLNGAEDATDYDRLLQGVDKRARNQPTQATHQRRRHRFEAHADPEIRRPPNEADRKPREVSDVFLTAGRRGHEAGYTKGRPIRGSNGREDTPDDLTNCES